MTAACRRVIPAVIGSDHIARRGDEGLRYLAEFARTAGLPASLAAQAETAPPGMPGRCRPPGPPDQAACRDMAVLRLAVTWHTERGSRARGFSFGPLCQVRARAVGSGNSPGGTGCDGAAYLVSTTGIDIK